MCLGLLANDYLPTDACRPLAIRTRSDAVENALAQIQDVNSELRKLEADRNRFGELASEAEVRIEHTRFHVTPHQWYYYLERHEPVEKLAARATFQDSADRG